MKVRNGVRPGKVTTFAFHTATAFLVMFLLFMVASFISSERLSDPWKTIGALSFVGFLFSSLAYSAGNLIDRRRAKRKAH